MCGVIGYQPREPIRDVTYEAFLRLFEESAIRGLHAFGLARLEGVTVNVSRALALEEVTRWFNPRYPTIAHTRYSTSGDWKQLSNNQPIVVGTTALAFNGVLHMGTKAEFEQAFYVSCATENDGEVFLQRLAKGETAEAFISSITGSFAGVWFADGRLHTGRNARRPLWECEAFGAHWYASTRDIFIRAGFPPPTEVPPLVCLEVA